MQQYSIGYSLSFVTFDTFKDYSITYLPFGDIYPSKCMTSTWSLKNKLEKQNKINLRTFNKMADQSDYVQNIVHICIKI